MAIWILIIEAVCVYGIVLLAHSFRHRFGLAYFYALIGGLTAVMSWVTDAGVQVDALGITFLVGSSVFYTSLILAVFVVYVFDGPRATRIAISTVVGVSAIVPIISLVLHFQAYLHGSSELLGFVPMPDLRINASSIFTTMVDLVFLAIAWEFLHKKLLRINLGVRGFLTLLGVMLLDVFLFNTLAFGGTPDYVNIMTGTMLSRLAILSIAGPMLWVYLSWQNTKTGGKIEQRPVLAILQQVANIKLELNTAYSEIERRKHAEKSLKKSRQRLSLALEVSNAGVYEHGASIDKGFWADEKCMSIMGKSPLSFETKKDFLAWLREKVHPHEVEELIVDYRQLVKGEVSSLKRVFRFKIKGPEYSSIEVRVKVVEWDKQHKPHRILGVLHDVTKRRRFELERDALISELEQARDELSRLSLLDELTGLANRRCFDDVYDREFQRAKRSKQLLSLLMIDLDYFKRFNDGLGHLAGDKCLKDVAFALSQTLRRPGDLVARYGGEEFVVLLPETDLKGAFEVAQRLRLAVIDLRINHPDSPIGAILTISVGAACFKAEYHNSPQDLLAKADEALYKAKNQGRNRVKKTQDDCKSS